LRKIVSIGLLCCLLVYIGGYHLVYAIHQFGLKQEMRAYLKTNPDIRYGSYFSLGIKNGQVTDQAFEWEEENEEFRYNSELYDVVTLQSKGDSLYISALKDDNENNLEQQVKQVRHSRQGSPVAAVSPAKFFPVLFVQADRKNTTEPAIPRQYAVFHSIQYPYDYSEVHTPPPRC
jgi:hypothetical protein